MDANSSTSIPRKDAISSATYCVLLGSLRRPLNGGGVKYGESVSIRIRSSGTCLATSFKLVDLGNTTGPAKEI